MEGYKRYQRRPGEVWARKVPEAMEVPTTNGTFFARAGDWIVIEGTGPAVVVSDEVFRKQYDMPESAKSPSGMFAVTPEKP